jgi:hypothetical protein
MHSGPLIPLPFQRLLKPAGKNASNDYFSLLFVLF